jgi:hypothetical protein
MRVVVVPTATPTKLVSAGGWTQFCDIYNDSDTPMRIVYDGTDPATLSVAAGSEVGVNLAPGGVVSLGASVASWLSKDVYALQASGDNKRVQIQEH